MAEHVIRLIGCVGSFSLLGACVVPIGIPATRVESGAIASSATNANQTGMQLKVGTHAASIRKQTDVSYDVGVGYLYEYYGPEVPPDEMAVVSNFDGDRTSIHGGYAEYGRRIDSLSNGAARFFVGMRGEMLLARNPSETQLGLGVAGRLTYEFAAGGEQPFSGSDNCTIAAGVTTGTSAIGVYAEAGYRSFEGDERAGVVTFGVSLRLPSILGFALVIPIPGC